MLLSETNAGNQKIGQKMMPILKNLGVQLGMKSQYNGPSGQLTLFFGNKSAGNLERLVASVPPAQQFQIQMQPLPDSIAPRKQIQVSRLHSLWFPSYLVSICRCQVSTPYHFLCMHLQTSGGQGMALSYLY